MQSRQDYWIAQLLILIFYIMALLVYHRARKAYTGGTIGAAINLILLFMIILFVSDLVDYFFLLFLPLRQDTVVILKILLRLVAICVLFFGGLKFFVSKASPSDMFLEPASSAPADIGDARRPSSGVKPSAESTVILQEKTPKKPMLGRYEIMEQIGQGAMGVVYKGRDPRLNRIIAIKTLRFSDEFDDQEVDDIRDQFYHEAEVVARLSHPNIVSIYDVGEDLELSYLAMEYLEGESLEKYTRIGNLLSVKKCVDVIIQVCDALSYAHGHGIIHRDIKPANIMFLKNGLVKVTDFGIARVIAGSKTRTGTIKGSPYYMSPEQAKGLELTGSSDIFSLGVVFYQLLTGRLPFSGETLTAILYHITTENAAPAVAFNPDIDPATSAILDCALEKNPRDRYRTAEEMGRQLRQAIRNTDEGVI